LSNFSQLVGCVGLYFIFVDNLSIPYPFNNSRLIYIGMSESKSNSIGNRLRNHISGHSQNKGILGYNDRWNLRFTYLDYEFLKHVFSFDKIESMETYFLEDFVKHFGSYPICNNRRGATEKTSTAKSKIKVDWQFFGE